MVLLNSKHQDDKNQFGCQENFEEKASNNRDVSTENSCSGDLSTGKKADDDSRSSNTAEDLSDNDETQANDVDGANGEHGDRDCWVE